VKAVTNARAAEIAQVAIGHGDLVEEQVARAIHTDSLSHDVAFLDVTRNVRGFVAWDIKAAITDASLHQASR
jgi:hypothetical protein